MSLLKDFRSALETKGYVLINNVPKKPKNDVWYRHANSTSLVEHVLYLRYMPSGKGYGVYVGAYNQNARSMAEHNLHTFAKYVDPSWLNSEELLARPCWQVFNTARAMNWEYGCIPSPLDPGKWEIDLELLFTKFINPTFLSIKNIDSLISLLLRSDMPFEWFMTNPTLRVLEIATMAKIMQADAKLLRTAIEPQFKVMRNNVPGGNVENMVDDIFFEVLGRQ